MHLCPSTLAHSTCKMLSLFSPSSPTPQCGNKSFNKKNKKEVYSFHSFLLSLDTHQLHGSFQYSCLQCQMILHPLISQTSLYQITQKEKSDDLNEDFDLSKDSMFRKQAFNQPRDFILKYLSVIILWSVWPCENVVLLFSYCCICENSVIVI